MLTSNLVRARVRGQQIVPSFIRPDAPALREAAESLCGTFADALAERRTRGEIDEEIDDLCGDRRDHLVVRGLAKLCFDRSEFAVDSPLPPQELRAEAFRLAAEMGPLALEPGPHGRPVAGDLLARIAEQHGVSADALADGMYADLKEAQRITAFDVPGPEWLLHRYNTALVQALLLRSVEVQIRLLDPAAPRMRQLFRAVKFHQLIHRARRDGSTLEVLLDGPTSLFTASTRYGLLLANFFPALLHVETPWTLRATVLWTRAKHRKTLQLDSSAGLVGHTTDRGGYERREATWFAERFTALDSDWELLPGKEPITLADRGVIFPDFTFERDGRTAHLEIVGFWRRDDLTRKLELVRDHGPGNLILAVSRKLRGSKEALEEHLGVPVVEFSEVVPARAVLSAIEEVAR